MTRQNISESKRSWLVDQMKDWQESGLLSTKQAHSILQLYQTKEELAQRKQSNAISLLTATAAMLMGLGVLLLVGYNWDVLPSVMKMALLFILLLTTMIGGYFLRYHRNQKTLSEVAFLFGCIIYGVSIFQIGQIFHFNSHYPSGVWWWAVGVLPFVLCLDSMIFHLLYASLLATWCGIEILGYHQIGMWWFGGRWTFVPNGAYSLPFLAMPCLLLSYKNSKPWAATCYVMLLSWWLVLLPSAWDLRLESVFLIGSIGSLLLVIAENHASGSRFAIPYRLFGFLMVAGVLLGLSALSTELGVSPWNRDVKGFLLVLSVVLATALVVAFSAYIRRLDSPGQDSLQALVGQLMIRQWLPVCMIAAMLIMHLSCIILGGNLLVTIIANIAIVALALWLSGVGLREDRWPPYVGGVAFFLIWTLVRYVDLFGGLGGMVGAALMFFSCGLLLFGVAFFWRNRKVSTQ